MRILLIRPNSPMAVTPPPIGLGYLSNWVKEKRGDDVLIIDGRRFRLSEGSVLRRISAYSPDIIGITAMTFEAPEALSLISLIKQEWPDIPVVVGGPHATAYGPSLLEKFPADYLVSGEGENVLVELLNSIELKTDPSSVKGLAWRNGDDIVFNGHQAIIEDIDSLDIDWEGIGIEAYFGMWTRNAMNTIARSGRRLPVFTSRGCPFGCSYCHHIFGRKYRTFSIVPVVDRMIMLRDRYRVREFEIIDDNFNLDLERAKAVMTEIIERKLDCAITFTNGLRADRMDEELLDLMLKAGTYRIDYAIESASERIQKMVHKNLNLGRAREVVNMTAGRGIITGTYNMLGFPGETEEEMQQTIDFALSLKNHIASFFYVMPFPGTELSEQDPQISLKVRSTDFRDASGIAINLSAVPDEVLMKLRRSGYRKFYFSPLRIARIVHDVPRNPRMLAAALAALRLSFKESVNY